MKSLATIRVIMGMSGFQPRQRLPWKGHDMASPSKSLYRYKHNACPLCGQEKCSEAKACRSCTFKRPSAAQPSDPSIRIIPLTRGLFAKVSAHRYAWAVQYKWHAQWNPCTRSFYAYRSEYLGKVDGKYKSLAVSMAREVLGLAVDDPRIADHSNHDTLDNTDDNLRDCTREQSMKNQRGKYHGKSKYKGVSWQKWRKSETNGSWYSAITVNGKKKFLGYADTELEAAERYIAAAKELHGEFACLERTCLPKL